jgi:hypothetical protein
MQLPKPLQIKLNAHRSLLYFTPEQVRDHRDQYAADKLAPAVRALAAIAYGVSDPAAIAGEALQALGVTRRALQ